MKNLKYCFKILGLVLAFVPAVSVSGVAQNLEPYRDWFGSYGYTDSLGNIVIECRYDDAKNFSEGYAAVLSRGGGLSENGSVFGSLSMTLKWGYIDTSGMLVIPCRYDLAGQFSEGYAAVMSGNKWGFIDYSGDTLVSYKYDEVKDFVNGYAAVRRGRLWGYIDMDGQEFVPCEYDVAGSFGPDGFAAVTKADSSGFVFRNGKWYATKDRALDWIRGIPFSVYARDKVMNKMNQWQRREAEESVPDWEARVNDDTFMARIEGLEMRTEAEYLEANRLHEPECLLGGYDDAAGSFHVSVRSRNRQFDMEIIVPVSDTLTVRNNWKKVKADFKYFIKNDRAAIREAIFTLPGKKIYEWHDPAYSAQQEGLDLRYSIKDMDLSLPGKIYREIRKYVNDSSAVDTDVNIPVVSGGSGNVYAIVIANENYLSGEIIPYALNDGDVFREYCSRRLGVREENIKMVRNGDAEDMKSVVAWLDKVSKLFNSDTRVIMYFAGKCVVDEGMGRPYLLSVDYVSNGVQGGIGLSDIYSRLLAASVDNAVFFIDASFSGIDREGMRSDVFDRGNVGLQALQPEERMVVFYAAGAGEGAYPYPAKRHGLFTYYLLKSLQNNPEGVTYGDMFDYIRANVRSVSSGLYGRTQDPVVYSSKWDGEAWRDFPL